MMRRLAFFLALTLVPSALEASNRTSDLKTVHDDVMKQIREKESAYEREQEKLKKTQKESVELAKRERRLLKQLEQADQALAKTRVELARLEEQLKAVQTDIEITREKLDTETLTLLERRRILGARLRELGMFGGPEDWLGSLLVYEDLSPVFQTWQGMSSLTEMDRAIIRLTEARRSDLAAGKALLEEKEKKIVEIQKQKTILSLRQEKERLRRKGLFEEVQSRRSALDELARQIEAEAANMNLLLTALREQAARLKEKLAYLKKDFEDRKGLLRWPVSHASVQSVMSYGKVYDESIKDWRMNKGIDIWTGSNQSVLAVSKGEVVFSDFFGRMGNMVVLSHGGDYFTLYAHLSEISVRLEDKVDDGAVLGRAGHTGRLGEDAVLHFEIRQGGNALDPMNWLGRRN